MHPSRDLALAAIGVYQRYLSPYKGFCCAYRVHTGQASCSTLGARAIRRFGVWPGLQLLKQRMRRCGEVHRRCTAGVQRRAQAAQRGGCDVDLPDADCCDALDFCDCCAFDWPGRKGRPDTRDAQRKSGKVGRWDGAADADASRRRG